MHNPTLTNPTEHGLHISYSQAFLYLNCSLKYYFRYVRGLAQEKTSIAPMFGKAVHKAVERYYKDIMLGNPLAGLDILQELFTEHLQADLASTNVPVTFKKDLPDEKQAIAMGHSMLEAAYPDLKPGPGAVVAGVEVPLSAPLVDLDGNSLDIDLKGVIDLLLLEGNVNPTTVDFKTAKQSKSQGAADKNLQMSVYAYLLAENGYSDLSCPVHCRFGVLRKLKSPKLETVNTARTQAHTDRLVKLMNAVLAGIENRVFIPNPGWLCGDCEYADACQAW